MFRLFAFSAAAGAAVFAAPAHATFVSLGDCSLSGAFDCIITTTPPDPVTANPNDGILLAWDEVQNLTLTEPLVVDRVFDPSADFVTDIGGGLYELDAGTVVSSHYLQWDPGNGSSSTVTTTISLDSQIFAFITDTARLAATDSLLGLAIDYADFGLRGLEAGDLTEFNGNDVDIRWGASSPGDWTRLITAFSPGGENPPPPPSVIPLPATLPLAAAGLGLLLGLRRRRH